ncbi:hypothetical protein [Paenibacillus massiliensis]|jgi:hypothetical protein|uniref:hypothetical protein n=1 Tax=Paenibacillus massiliensis TaxID=225917 RepID=UPI00048E8F56|nr:hypothetical protein [Paenibacillus massiliensis]
MDKDVLWSEDLEFAYGRTADFSDKADFIAHVKSWHADITGERCDVVDVEVCTGMYTDQSLEAEKVVLLKYTNVQIENWYVGRIEEPEKVEETD